MRRRAAWLALLLCTASVAAGPSAQTPTATARMSANDLYKVRGMMREAYETVKKNYYDPSFRDGRQRLYS